MSGRSMIVGRQHLVGARHGSADELSELMGYATGADDTPVATAIPAAGPAAYTRGQHLRVIEEHPTHEREFPIGFTSPTGTPVPANGTQQIQALPQVLFRGERLAVPNSIVLNFQVQDVKVGKNSQLAAPGNLPAECFSNISIGVRMQLESAEPGITITLNIVNLDANNAHAFAAVLYGTVME